MLENLEENKRRLGIHFRAALRGGNSLICAIQTQLSTNMEVYNLVNRLAKKKVFVII